MDGMPAIDERGMILRPTWSGVVRATAFYWLILLIMATALAAATAIWVGVVAAFWVVVVASAAPSRIVFAIIGGAKVLHRTSLTIDDDGLVVRGVIGTMAVRWDEAERVERRGPRRDQVWIWRRAKADGKRPDPVIVTPYFYARSAEGMLRLIADRISASADLA